MPSTVGVLSCAVPRVWISCRVLTGLCGGAAGTSQCAPPGTPTDTVVCNNGQWAGAYCSDGYTCQPNPGPLVWTCLSPSIATGGRRLLGLS